jgi:hypothetical protein
MKWTILTAVSLSLLSAISVVQAADPETPAAPASDAPVERPDSSAQDLPPISAVEELLWMGDQLKSIDEPTTLQYEFRKSGSLEEGFTDSVQFHITDVRPDGMKGAKVNFFTGPRNLYVPPFDSINGNVLLAIFLQGDILEMKRLTDVGSRFFQQKIKYAMATSAKTADVEIDFNGAKVPGKQVTITPYVDDPKAETNERFHKLKDKVYTFTVSEQVPGFLYSIRTYVPAPKDAADPSMPLNEEVLQLTGVAPLAAPVAEAAAAQ